MSILILFIAALARFFGVMRPLVGNFATKGLAYAVIAKNFSKDPVGILYPTLDVIVNGEKSLHMMEWPFFSYFVGFFYRVFPLVPLDALGRLSAALFFVFSGWFFYRFCMISMDKKTSIYALLFYVFFPIGIIYGQSFQLEAAMMFCISGIFLYIQLWIKDRGTVVRAFIIWVLISMLLLMKMQLLCLGLAVFVLLLTDKQGRKLLKNPFLYVFSAACLVLPVLWYFHTFQVAMNKNNVFFSIIYSMKIRQFPDPRIFTHGFYLQMFKTLIKETFSPAGFLLVLLGGYQVTRLKNNIRYVISAYLVAMLVYALALPRKMFEMNYYFMPLIFPGAIMAAYGMRSLMTKAGKITVIVLFLLGSLLIAYRPSFTPFPEIEGFRQYFKDINSMIPPDSRVIVTSGKMIPEGVLFYSGHAGWSFDPVGVSQKDQEIKARKELGMAIIDKRYFSPEELLEKYRAEGARFYFCDDADHLKAVNRPFYEYLKDRYSIIKEKDYLIVELKGK